MPTASSLADSPETDNFTRVAAPALTEGGQIPAMMDLPPSSSPTKENESPFDASLGRSSYAAPQSRGSALSWQRRPNSQAGPRTRPLSMVAAENAAVRSGDLVLAPEDVITKDQIAQALSSKDLTWFRQTSDRADKTPALQKLSVEDPDHLGMLSLRTQLPGTSPETPTEPQKDPTISHLPSTGAMSPPGSPFPLTPSQRLEPSTASMVDVDTSPVEKTSPRLQGTGRTSPTRSNSPTKGLGGFVQSAMMKRSDSVSKRWSIQSPPALARADAIASNRQSRDLGRLHSKKPSISPKSRPASILLPTSATGTPVTPDIQSSVKSCKADELRPGEAQKPTASLEARVASEESHSQAQNLETPPASPSKITDPRRWSPTKASWLESALNKPESPKAKPTPPAGQQPSWMVELNKAKAHKASNPSADLGTPSSTVPLQNEASSLRGNLKKAPPAPDSVRRTNLADGKPFAALKAKPETPPKKDFRASLKHQPAVPLLPSSKPTQEPLNELKSVAGNLRRTTTQNYKAPDEFRDNILRGKAALNVTEGPKKSERKDELKNAILKKKEEFKKAQMEGRGVAINTSSIPDEKPLPEGLAKRATLGQSNPASQSTRSSLPVAERLARNPEATHPISLPQHGSSESPAGQSSASLKPVSVLASGPKSVLNVGASSTSNTTYQPPAVSPTTTTDCATSELEVKKATEAEPTKPKWTPAGATPVTSKFKHSTPMSAGEETVASAKPPGKTGSSLADRFNPALAGLLARGPPRAAATPSAAAKSAGPGPAGTDEPQKPGPQLTHMTKNRARGPRRKVPTTCPMGMQKTQKASQVELGRTELQRTDPAVSAQDIRSTPPPIASERSNIMSNQQSVNKNTKTASVEHKPSALADAILPVEPSKKVMDAPTTEPQPRKITLADSSNPSPVPHIFQAVANQDNKMEPAQISMASIHEQVAIAAAAKAGLPPPKCPLKEKPTEKIVQPPSPKKLDMSRMFKFDNPQSDLPKAVDSPRPTPKPLVKPKPAPEKPATIRPEEPTISPSLEPQQGSEPEPPPPADLEGDVLSQVAKTEAESAKLTSANLPGLGATPPSTTPRRPKQGTLSLAATEGGPIRSSSSHPMPPKLAVSSSSAPPRARSPARSPTRHGSDIAGLLGDFFGSPRPKRNYQVDTAGILAAKPESHARIQTLKSELFKVSEMGKKQPVPPHYERVLFEREMYLCSHTYVTDSQNQISEIYFWAGDEVPLPVREDAEIFVAREARAMGGKLVKLQQGKETPEFIQALGGVVIMRRGMSNKYDSLAPNMLCGRRHYGEIVFDEVDFSVSSLCSGFPFLITQQSNCWLWKGRGSDIDELSCARLIGMDLTLTGELDEVDEGSETDSFWDMFGTRPRMSSADHWRLKPNYQRYSSRLFCSDASDQRQVREFPITHVKHPVKLPS